LGNRGKSGDTIPDYNNCLDGALVFGIEKVTSIRILISNHNFCPEEFFRMLLRQELGMVSPELPAALTFGEMAGNPSIPLFFEKLF